MATTRLSGRTFTIPRIAPTAMGGAEAAFAEARAFLSSREARQMSVSDLERELHRRHQELVRHLLQEHRGQRSPTEAPGPVEGVGATRVEDAGGVECSQRREDERRTKTASSTVKVPHLRLAPCGPDGLHPSDATRNLTRARYCVEVRRRATIATASRAPPRMPLQVTVALDIIHAGLRLPARHAACGTRRGIVPRCPTPLVGSARCRVQLVGLAFSHRRSDPRSLTAALR